MHQAVGVMLQTNTCLHWSLLLNASDCFLLMFMTQTCHIAWCSFFLQLSLLDLDLSLLPASLLAAAALANSMELFGKESWPATLQHYSAYTPADLEATRTKLNQVRCKSALLQ